MSAAVAATPHTNDTAGARRIAGAFAAARAAGRAALIPYVVAGYPDAETSFAAACAAIDSGRRPARDRASRTPIRSPTAPPSSAPRRGRSPPARPSIGRSALVGRIASARPACPVVAMGYANQLIGGGDGRDRARALAEAGVAGVIVADLTPDEGAPFEAVAVEAGIAVVYLVAPTTSPARRAAVAARSGGFLYCVSLVGVTGARTSLPPTVARLVREVRAVSPVPGGGGLRGLDAGPRAGDRRGRRRWGHRGLGARGCARSRRARRGGAGRPGRRGSGRRPDAEGRARARVGQPAPARPVRRGRCGGGGGGGGSSGPSASRGGRDRGRRVARPRRGSGQPAGSAGTRIAVVTDGEGSAGAGSRTGSRHDRRYAANAGRSRPCMSAASRRGAPSPTPMAASTTARRGQAEHDGAPAEHPHHARRVISQAGAATRRCACPSKMPTIQNWHRMPTYSAGTSADQDQQQPDGPSSTRKTRGAPRRETRGGGRRQHRSPLRSTQPQRDLAPAQADDRVRDEEPLRDDRDDAPRRAARPTAAGTLAGVDRLPAAGQQHLGHHLLVERRRRGARPARPSASATATTASTQRSAVARQYRAARPSASPIVTYDGEPRKPDRRIGQRFPCGVEPARSPNMTGPGRPSRIIAV